MSKKSKRRERSRKVEYTHEGIKIMVIPSAMSLVATFTHENRVHRFMVKGVQITDDHIQQALGEAIKKIDSLLREDTVLGRLAKKMRSS